MLTHPNRETRNENKAKKATSKILVKWKEVGKNMISSNPCGSLIEWMASSPVIALPPYVWRGMVHGKYDSIMSIKIHRDNLENWEYHQIKGKLAAFDINVNYVNNDIQVDLAVSSVALCGTASVCTSVQGYTAYYPCFEPLEHPNHIPLTVLQSFTGISRARN